MSDYVCLNYIEEYDIEKLESVVQDTFSKLNIEKFLRPKMKVLIKINAPDAFSKDLAKTTNPAVVGAVIKVLNSMGVKCLVADSPYKNFSINGLDRIYFETGMLDMANSTNCELNRNTNCYEQEIPNGVSAKSLLLMDCLNEVDAIINIGKLKMDEKLGYLGALSNLFGFVVGEYKNLVLNRLKNLKSFSDMVIDLEEVLSNKLVLNVLDGIVALEAGDSPRMLSCLAVSDNPYALDAAVLKILGLPYDSTIISEAAKRGHINLKYPYKLLGEETERFVVEDFALYDYNLETEINPNKSKQKAYFRAHQKTVEIKPSRCKGCGVCAKICPTNAIMMKYDKNGELFAEIDYSKCIFCYRCREACPYKVVDFNTPFGYKAIMKNLKNAKNDEENNEKS